jgi:hypothetical protein
MSQDALNMVMHGLAHGRNPDRAISDEINPTWRWTVTISAAVVLIVSVIGIAMTPVLGDNVEELTQLYVALVSSAAIASLVLLRACSDQTFDRLSRVMERLISVQTSVFAVGALLSAGASLAVLWMVAEESVEVARLALPVLVLQGVSIALSLTAFRLLPPLISASGISWRPARLLVRVSWPVSYVSASLCTSTLLWLGGRTFVAAGVGTALAVASFAHMERTRSQTNQAAKDIRSSLTRLYLSAGICSDLSASRSDWLEFRAHHLEAIDALQNPLWGPLLVPPTLRCDRAVLVTLGFAAAAALDEPVPSRLSDRYQEAVAIMGTPHRHEVAAMVAKFARELHESVSVSR